MHTQSTVLVMSTASDRLIVVAVPSPVVHQFGALIGWTGPGAPNMYKVNEWSQSDIEEWLKQTKLTDWVQWRPVSAQAICCACEFSVNSDGLLVIAELRTDAVRSAAWNRGRSCRCKYTSNLLLLVMCRPFLTDCLWRRRSSRTV